MTNNSENQHTTAMCVGMLAYARSNCLSLIPSVFGTYLHGNGVRNIVLSTLNQFNLTISVTSVKRIFRGLETGQKDLRRKLDAEDLESDTAILTYNSIPGIQYHQRVKEKKEPIDPCSLLQLKALGGVRLDLDDQSTESRLLLNYRRNAPLVVAKRKGGATEPDQQTDYIDNDQGRGD
jgi:hypothetical protein